MTLTAMDERSITITIPVALADMLDRVARLEGMSPERVARRAFAVGLDRLEMFAMERKPGPGGDLDNGIPF